MTEPAPTPSDALPCDVSALRDVLLVADDAELGPVVERRARELAREHVLVALLVALEQWRGAPGPTPAELEDAAQDILGAGRAALESVLAGARAVGLIAAVGPGVVHYRLSPRGRTYLERWRARTSLLADAAVELEPLPPPPSPVAALVRWLLERPGEWREARARRAARERERARTAERGAKAWQPGRRRGL